MKLFLSRNFMLTSLLLAVSFFSVQAQTSASVDPVKGWHLAARSDSGYNGIALDQAYSWLKSNGKKSTPVIVAVIDSGIDTLHEDLKSVLWRNIFA